LSRTLSRPESSRRIDQPLQRTVIRLKSVVQIFDVLALVSERGIVVDHSMLSIARLGHKQIPKSFAQQILLQLAHRVAWQIFDEDHALWQFEFGETF
jgi:hypothetical protein